MLIKKIVLAVAAIIALYSAETNASTLQANDCTLGLLPFAGTMAEESKREEILKAYEAKGFIVTEMRSPKEINQYEFISDATVECTPTPFGNFSKTTVRIIETATNKIVARTMSPGVMSVVVMACPIELVHAINALPVCQIK